jgi:hypothetical protein
VQKKAAVDETGIMASGTLPLKNKPPAKKRKAIDIVT